MVHTTPRSLRFRLSGLLKSVVLAHYRVPFSRHGLDAGLVPFLPGGRPITLVDIGASSGSFTAAVHDHCGIRRALLVEPQPARCRELAARFDDPRFVVRQAVASDAAGAVDLDILNFDYSTSMLRAIPGAADGGQLDLRVRERISVAASTLDALVRDAALEGAIDLLKIDVQGAEGHVLRGAAAVLPRVRLIWTEVSFRPLYQGSAVFADVHAQLGAMGFRLYSIHEGFRSADGELLQADALFVGPEVRTPS